MTSSEESPLNCKGEKEKFNRSFHGVAFTDGAARLGATSTAATAASARRTAAPDMKTAAIAKSDE